MIIHFSFIEPKNFESKLVTSMMELFKVLYASRPKRFMYTQACNPGPQNIRATVCALIDVMFLFASPENQELTSYVTTMCLDPLVNAVRLTPCVIIYNKIFIKPRSKAAIPKSISSDADATDRTLFQSATQGDARG